MSEKYQKSVTTSKKQRKQIKRYFDRLRALEVALTANAKIMQRIETVDRYMWEYIRAEFRQEYNDAVSKGKEGQVHLRDDGCRIDFETESEGTDSDG